MKSTTDSIRKYASRAMLDHLFHFDIQQSARTKAKDFTGNSK